MAVPDQEFVLGVPGGLARVIQEIQDGSRGDAEGVETRSRPEVDRAKTRRREGLRPRPIQALAAVAAWRE